MHENVTIGEVVFNMDVWKGLSPTHKEIMQSASNETFLIWWAKWQRQNADAMKEMQEKHGVRILRTPPDILTEFLKTWDKIAAEEGAKSPFFKKVHDSQRAYCVARRAGQAIHVPAVLVCGQPLLPEAAAKPAAAQPEPKKK
jgi:TRAP-type mannitol/chloroaromatic compound transport system substrate-binding protein